MWDGWSLLGSGSAAWPEDATAIITWGEQSGSHEVITAGDSPITADSDPHLGVVCLVVVLFICVYWPTLLLSEPKATASARQWLDIFKHGWGDLEQGV